MGRPPLDLPCTRHGCRGSLNTVSCSVQSNPLGPAPAVVSIIRMRPSRGVSFILSHTPCGTHVCTAAHGLWFPESQSPRTTDGSERRGLLLCKWASHFPPAAPPPSHPVPSHDSLQLAGLVPPTPLLSPAWWLLLVATPTPCCESPLPGSRLGGGHEGGGLGEGKVHEVGRDALLPLYPCGEEMRVACRD